MVNMDSDAHVIPETKLAQYYDYESDSDLEDEDDEDDGLGSESGLPESPYRSRYGTASSFRFGLSTDSDEVQTLTLSTVLQMKCLGRLLLNLYRSSFNP